MSKSESTSDSSSPGTDPTYIPSTDTTSFIETSGGLLTEQTILSLRQERFDHPAAKPETFALPGEDPPTQNELEERIALVWEDLVERWDEVTQKGRLFEMDISEARSKWILKLFQALNFEPVYQRSNLEVEGMKFDLSHRGWPDDEIEDYGNMGGARAPLLHTIEPETERDLDRENKLDRKPEGAGRGASSPHDTLQSFLNASQEHNWGIVTDGVTLRVLRDYYHTYTRGYVEFDLENIFTSRNYQDFRALYRLCHPSRFLPRNKDALDKPLEEVLRDNRDETEEDEEAELSTPLEMLYQTSLSTGVKVGQDLQSNVISALETLGNGLLNPEIRDFLREGGEEEAQEYYQELLMIIYRLLFLLYAEQRGMMPGRDSLYTDEYSITKLRQRAEKRRSKADTNTDLWHGLQATFKLAEEGNEELGVPAYNGMLFDSEKLNHISESECTNKALLSAISDLTLIEHDGVLQRISYADLGVEEVGSIYESLLEFTPRLAEEKLEIEGETVHSGDFYLDSRGMERKETGSYYTDPKLVQELIKSALEPVVDDRLKKADETKEAQEAALLDIDVVDPACGSAAFLIAATNYLGRRLAEIREEMEYPLEDDVRDARRSVLQHCIYGVDLNPMAVELAKVSLWIDSAVEDKPLNFLDHHIKCGNSLLGTTEELVNKGVPVDAYETSKGREGHIGNDLRKRVRNENDSYNTSNSRTLNQFGGGVNEFASYTERLSELEEDSADDIHEKERAYSEFQEDIDYKREMLIYDVWTAAFFWPLDGSAKEYPTPKTIQKLRSESQVSDEELREIFEYAEKADEWSESVSSIDSDLLDVIGRAKQFSKAQRFFHWELEFPEVYRNGGFDCVLGNPPWERVKFQQKEFFATRDEEIASASTKSKRTKLIKELKSNNPSLHTEYEAAVNVSESISTFLRESGRFPLSAVGDINTYQVFAGLVRRIVDDEGRVGIIVPSGIATDYYNQDYFDALVENHELISLYDFENSGGIFPGVHRSYKFCLLTLTGTNAPSTSIDFAFFMTEVKHLSEEYRHFTMTSEELQAINPNTGTCPTFRTKRDAELVKKLYHAAPLLINEERGENPWGVSFSTMFHMTNDSDLTLTRQELEEEGHVLQENGRFEGAKHSFLPVYEGKMVETYNHRSATIEVTDNVNRSAQPKLIDPENLKNPEFIPLPLHWIDEDEVDQRYPDNWPYQWAPTIKRVTAATNHRTVVGPILPYSAISYTLITVFPSVDTVSDGLCLFGNIWSFTFDYIVRNKTSQPSLPQYVVEQTPAIPPKRYTDNLKQLIVPRVLELSYTSWDVTPFGDDVWADSNAEVRNAIEEQWHTNKESTGGGHQDEVPPQWVKRSDERNERFPHPPFMWDEERRSVLRAELDALYAHLYDLEREEIEYILDTFPIIKRKDEKEYDEYRTKRLILEKYDEYESKVELPEVTQ